MPWHITLSGPATATMRLRCFYLCLGVTWKSARASLRIGFQHLLLHEALCQGVSRLEWPVIIIITWGAQQIGLHHRCNICQVASQATCDTVSLSSTIQDCLGTRLDKAEEVGKVLAGLQSEVNQLSQNVAGAAARDNKDSAEQKDWAKMMEDRLAGLERGLEANANNVKQLGDNVAVFKNIDISQLQSLPPRVDALEHFMEDSKHFMEDTKHFMDDTKHFMDDTKHFIEDSKNFMDDTKHFMEDTKHFMDECTHFMEATKHFMEDSQHFMEDTKNFMDDVDKDQQERERAEKERADREAAGKALADKERADREAAAATKAGLPPPPPPPPVVVPDPPKVESPKRRSSYVPDLATIQMLKDKLESLGADFKAQGQKVSNLESQCDQLKELLQQTTKAHSLDLEALQKSLRTLRSDFDSKPFLDLNLAGMKSGDKSAGAAGTADLSVLEAAVADLQRRIQRKADSDDVEQLLRTSDITREAVEKLGAKIEELQEHFRKGSVSSGAAIDELKMQIKRSSILAAPEISRRGSVVSDRIDKRCQKLEDDLAALELKVAGKVDSSMLDELRFKVTVVEGKQDQAAKAQAMPRRDSESILLRLKDLISNKVDRDEFLQLHVLLEAKSAGAAGTKTGPQEEGLELELQGQRPDAMKEAAAAQLLQGQSSKYNELREELDKLKKEMLGLSERSDLAVLLARRADNIVQPVATLHDGAGRDISAGSPDDETITKAINDHAERITEYSDMLLQMETLMSSKADLAGLQALKNAIVDLQKRKQSRMSGIQIPGPSQEVISKVETDYMLPEETTETIKKHDMLLTQLSKNVELLNQAAFIMSGHDQPQTAFDDSGQFASDSEEPVSERRSSVRFHGDVPFNGVRPATAPTYDFSPETPGDRPPMRPATASAAASRPASAPNGNGFGMNPEMERKSRDFSGHDASEYATRPASGLSHVMQDGEHGQGDGHQFGNDAYDLGYDPADENNGTIVALEEALKAHKIEPKQNVSKLARWARDIQKLGADLNMLRTFMQDGLALKCDKSEHQRLAKLVRDFIARIDGEKAMLSGKPLIGFKCMSCDHPLEKLLQGRADHVPTNLMPKNCLPMLSAERIFGRDNKRDDSPPRSPPGGDYTRPVSRKNGYEQPVKDRKVSSATPKRALSAAQMRKPQQQPRQDV